MLQKRAFDNGGTEAWCSVMMPVSSTPPETSWKAHGVNLVHSQPRHHVGRRSNFGSSSPPKLWWIAERFPSTTK